MKAPPPHAFTSREDKRVVEILRPNSLADRHRIPAPSTRLNGRRREPASSANRRLSAYKSLLLMQMTYVSFARSAFFLKKGQAWK
ncbi:unnamed protein product [Rangifer tarandus platyrhynchus]|uniref:Uncharacterized protein n=1 Tax=Rangifer tarandus platyrhynchus TaxID=3082113 RepID=A0AC59ZE11_RANTA